tara:strand:- start:298 stop:981 length:684 start_codon:yes stop_codon:yes gene_type:complete
LNATLYIVSTPIGNLKDISSRALDVLSNVNIIACEDTRITRRLLSHYNIKNKMVVYNDYNSKRKVEGLIDYLQDGNTLALVSDAGTPCISDPGYRLVNAAHIHSINVVSVPGASSVHAALSISGLPTDNYFFQGFLPKKKGRKTKFDDLSKLNCTIVIFESPKRVKKTLLYIHEKLGNRIVSVCKEITKMYETVYFGKLDKIIKDFSEINPKGEYVILIAKSEYELK